MFTYFSADKIAIANRRSSQLDLSLCGTGSFMEMLIPSSNSLDCDPSFAAVA